MKTTKEITEEIEKLRNEYSLALKKESQDFVNTHRGKWFARDDSYFKILGLSNEFFILVLRINSTWKGIEITRPTGHFEIEDLEHVRSDYYKIKEFEDFLTEAANECRSSEA